MGRFRFQLLRAVPLAALVICVAGPAAAQIPQTLLHTIPPPPGGEQRGAALGDSVAMEGNYIVAGAPQDDRGAEDSGVVKVFDAMTSALLILLPNPDPAEDDNFGGSVAISGTFVAVGAAGDNTGAPDAGRVYVFDLSSATPAVPLVILNNPGPAADDRFGHAVAISGMRVVAGALWDDTGADDSGSAYVYDLSSGTPGVPVRTLNNPGPAATDRFGVSVAISGTRVVVGALGDDTGASDAGSAYVYDLSGATPTVPVNTLNNPTPATGDGFGVSVAISGMRVVAAAWFDDTGASNAGSACVYDLSGATPTVPVATLYNPGPAASDFFGTTVAISGTWVAVAATKDDTAALNSGIAYAYDMSSGTPTAPVVTLISPGAGAFDDFGVSLAISGTRLVVGSRFDDTATRDAGTVYVYDLVGAAPTVPVATLNHQGPAAKDYFGHSVAVSGARVVVGVYGDNTAEEDAGSAYVYDLGSATPTLPIAAFHNPNPVMHDYFGGSVAIDGTLVVVGATGDNTASSDPGSAYVYDLNSATPTVPVAIFENPGLPGSHAFGDSVSISGTRVAVGVPMDDTGAPGAGRAYVYDLSSATPTVAVATLDNPNPASFDRFGDAVAISGTRVVVGVPQSDIGADAAGRVYVYDLSSATPDVPVRTLNNPGPAADDNFGYAVAISGTRVVVGAFGNNTGAARAGSVYVYEMTGVTPTVPVATLNNPGPAVDDFFGFHVAVSGSRLIVGTMRDDTGATDAGSAYVFDLSGATPTVPVATMNNPGPGAGDNFALTVAIDGTTIAIGTPNDDGVLPDQGAAYIFGPASNDTDNDGLLDAWELTHWPTITGHSARDDFDHDGYNELLELAFGLNPTVASPGGIPPVVVENGFLTMTITKQAGVNYEVQSGGTVLPGPADSFSPATTTVLIDNATTLKVRDNFLIGTPSSRFLRMKVTAAP